MKIYILILLGLFTLSCSDNESVNSPVDNHEYAEHEYEDDYISVSQIYLRNKDSKNAGACIQYFGQVKDYEMTQFVSSGIRFYDGVNSVLITPQQITINGTDVKSEIASLKEEIAKLKEELSRK